MFLNASASGTSKLGHVVLYWNACLVKLLGYVCQYSQQNQFWSGQSKLDNHLSRVRHVREASLSFGIQSLLHRTECFRVVFHYGRVLL